MVRLDSIRYSRVGDKGRWSSLGSPTAHVVLLVLLISTFICLLRLSGCPGPPACKTSSQGLNYLLVLPENMSFPVFRPHYTNDLSRLVDLHSFAFTMNNPVCNNTSPLLLGLVHSAPVNTERRASIRSTWGSMHGDDFKLLFLVGRPESAMLQSQLEQENHVHHDLVQGNFLDVYRNLTYKHVMALKWTTYFCPKAKYVLKTDDDVFVNVPGLLAHINNHLSPLGARRLLMCVSVRKRVVRSFRSKWRVSALEYRPKMYPQYCPGFVVLYSTDVVFRLYNEAQSAKYFWVDDVFITGILASRANLAHTRMGEFCMNKTDFNNFLAYGNLPSSFLFGPINLEVDEIKAFWEKMVLLNQTHRSPPTVS